MPCRLVRGIHGNAGAVARAGQIRHIGLSNVTRELMEQIDDNLLYRWFVRMNLDEAVWDVTVFTKNRESRMSILDY